MSSVIAALFESPLAARYRYVAIPTYDGARPVRRALVFARSLLRLTWWCAGRGGRIVHVHATVRGSMHRKAACVLMAKALRRPVVLHFHAGAGDLRAFHEAIGPIRRWAFQATLRLADRVLSVSAPSARELEARFGARLVEVLPNAAPLQVGQGDLPPGAGGPRLLYLGGFANPVKGGEILLRALPTILEGLPEIQVALAGPGKAPAGVDRFAENRVQQLGWLTADPKARELREAMLFVLPSTSEGMPVALLEAMASGRPIVASAVGGVPDVVTDGVEALLVPPGRPDALAEAVIRLGRDAELRLRLGRAAFAAAERLSPQVIDQKLDALYASLAR